MNQLTFGLSVTILGMVVVFVGLIVLILCVKAISLISGTKAPKQAAVPPAQHCVTVSSVSQAAAQGPSPEVVAAITAAIAAMWQGETGFVIRHMKRIHNAPAWNRAGREEQTYSRF